MGGTGRAGLGHAPAALQLHAHAPLEDLGDFNRQRRAAGSDAYQRRQIAPVEIGQCGDRDPHRRHAGKIGGALDLDIAHHGFDIETLVQRDQMAAAEAGEQHYRQRKDVEQRQHADHALDRVVALGARRLAPDVVDRHRRSQIAMAEHGALRQAGGTAGILQQGGVIDADGRPLRRPDRAIGEFPVRHDRRVIRDRRVRIADRAPVVVLADDQPVEQALFQKFQRRRQQRREIAGDQHARAAVAQLVRQCDRPVERGKMHDAGAGLQRAEKVDGMIGRIAEEQRHRRVAAAAGAQERGSRDLDHGFEFGIADCAVAEFDRRPRAKLLRGLRQEIRQRAAHDRVVPADALRIELFAGVGLHLRARCAPSPRGGWGEGVRSIVMPDPLTGSQERSDLSHGRGGARTGHLFQSHHAAFAVCASEANVPPSAARRLSSGDGSSEGSLVSFA